MNKNIKIKHYTCYRTNKPIVIDAAPDKPIWKKTPPLDRWLITVDPEKLYKPATFPTAAWMCWDNKSLYVAFKCTDKDITASRTKKDSDVWEDDAFEIFIDPAGNGKKYVEIELNPLNAKLDLLVSNPMTKNWKQYAKFDVKGLETAVMHSGTLNFEKDNDKCWWGEIKIPFKGIARGFRNKSTSFPPKHGDTWRIGLFRSERGTKIKGCPQEWNSWSPTITNHTPGQFGYVTFSNKTL